jgi:hypothetical protein
MPQNIRLMTLSMVLLFGSGQSCWAQYGGASQWRGGPPISADHVRAAVRTLLLQVDHLVEDMEMDLQRDPMSERLLLTADEVRDEAEQLAVSAERTVDLNHMMRDFQEFDAAWHRLTRQVSRCAPDDRHLQRNVARISQTDSELHRLLHVPAPVNVQELQALTAALHRATQHIAEDLETDLRGARYQRALLMQVGTLEEAIGHLEANIVAGADIRHLRQDFDTVDDAWSRLAGSLRELSSMRFDHVQRAAANVATAEGQLRAALGVDPNPEQFTCYRAAPSELRQNLPYASGSHAVPIPSGWRIGPTPGYAPRPAIPAGAAATTDNTPDLSFALNFLFGADSREKGDRPQPRRSDDNDDDRERRHDNERPGPPIRKVGPSPSSLPVTPPGNANSAVPVPSKPTESALQSKVDKNLARLSPENRAAALAQRTCPVSGELLGSHGTPIKMKVKGKDDSGKRREVFVCCDECEDKLEDHPDRYLDRHGDRD